MSIFGTILSTIFGHAGVTPAGASTANPQVTLTPSGTAAPQATPPGASPTTAPAPAPAAATAPAQPVDVAAILSALAAKAPQPLNWRQSIVDLMKLLGLDSSLAARKQLAEELH